MIALKSFRFAVPLALVAACSAPEVPQSPAPPPVSAAVFDPTTNSIPLPNDIALASIPSSLPPGQQELLRAFQAQGGFPNDQEVPVTISFQTTGTASDGTVITTAPDLDFASFNAGTLLVFLQTAQGAGTVALDPIQPSDYVKSGTQGTLTLHNKGRLPWTPGQYVLALRGGPNGIKTTGGTGIVAAPVFFLIAQGQPLNTEQGLSLLAAQTGSRAAAQAAAAQLQPIIDQYKAAAFPAVDRVFPHQEAASMTTFRIAPIAGTQVQLDPGRGLVPLPIDLLRDPRPASASCAACGKLTPVAACTFAQGTLDAQGVCRDSKGNVNAAAGGFAALDGFSTTGFILSPTSDLVTASTITPTTVKIFDLTNPAQPALLDPTTYITGPVELTQSGFSSVIALQPAGATAGDQTSVFRTRPLKDATDYAVVITDGVHDKTGKALVPGTVAKILQFANPVADANGKSQLTGIDDATASGLEAMRQKLVPVLNSPQVNKGHVAMAFTFHTQTILATGAQLGALPYKIVQGAPAKGAPTAVVSLTAAQAFSKYGADAAVIPTGNIAEILETTITTFNLLDLATGAFNPSGTTADETINVLIARPALAAVPPCAGPSAGLAPLKCSPMVLFRHGLGGGRANMLQVADSFNANGFTVVAIDAAKHGDRSFCTSGTALATLGGIPNVQQCGKLVPLGGTASQCTQLLPPGAQGDAVPIGTCAPAQFTYLPVSRTCLGACGWAGTEGIPTVSSNYLVTSNFFRTRDTLRQDIIDESQVVQAIAFVPRGAPPTGHTVFDHFAAQGFVIDPSQIFFAGQSLGAIQGTVDVATNPRISRAVLNVGGGTVVDVFTNSPAFLTTTDALLASLNIQRGANAPFLQFLIVAKTILDPADPVNFASHLQANTLPDLLTDQTGRTAQAPKKVLTQAAFCDQTVPNPFNFVLDSTMGTGPLLGFPGFGGPGTFQLFIQGGLPNATVLASCPSPTSGQGPPAVAVSHPFFTDWAIPTITTKAQADAAAFLLSPTPRSSLPLQIP